METKITKEPLGGKYWLVCTDRSAEVIIILTKNEVERVQDQIEDILLETLDT